MIQYYFDYNGKRYGHGTIVRVKWGNSEKTMIFAHCDLEKGYYEFKFEARNTRDGYIGFSYTPERLQKDLLEVTNRIDTKYVEWHPIRAPRKTTFKDELEIEGMLIAWAWYIVLMVVTFIFNGFIFYWAFFSICFWIYRMDKLKKEGFKR